MKVRLARTRHCVLWVEGIATDRAREAISASIADGLDALQLCLVSVPADMGTKVLAQSVQQLAAEEPNGWGGQNGFDLHFAVIAHLLFVLLVFDIGNQCM